MKTILAAAALAVGLLGMTVTVAEAGPHHGGHRHCTSWSWHHHHHDRSCSHWGW